MFPTFWSPSVNINLTFLFYIYVTRYDTLQSTHEDLLKKDLANQEALETERANYKKFNDEKNNEILNFTNQVCSEWTIF